MKGRRKRIIIIYKINGDQDKIRRARAGREKCRGAFVFGLVVVRDRTNDAAVPLGV